MDGCGAEAEEIKKSTVSALIYNSIIWDSFESSWMIR